ncbi:MAG: aminodeoxychorismate/anthranilate synthase component II [Gallicola sp.]|nr:aminodeoxychorismate/anthranilate synthase component II [Gallicola sp.]
MFLIIDNYDSFVYNLATYFVELHCTVKIFRNDKISIEEIELLRKEHELEAIILSPGPKSPAESRICLDIVNTFSGIIPILGVCLGHQIIGYCNKAEIIKAPVPQHGKISSISHSGKRLFENLPNPMNVTRYHSLIVDENSLSDDFYIDAKTDEGIIMALSHKTLPVFGVQFHPEAVLTEKGHKLLENFIKIAKEWNRNDNKN